MTMISTKWLKNWDKVKIKFSSCNEETWYEWKPYWIDAEFINWVFKTSDWIYWSSVIKYKSL